jgi:SAM-dependent methyltransferase
MSSAFRCHACYATEAIRNCSVADYEYNMERAPVDYAQCARCLSFTQTPMPSMSELAAAYPAAYHSFGSRSFIARRRQSMRVDRLKTFFSRGDVPVVLDYGCGQGNFLLTLCEHFDTGVFYGFEIADEDSVETLLDGRVVIFRGRIESHADRLPLFDIITMNHVIEHLPEPMETLKFLSQKLKVGGVFEGQTPNADSLEQRIFGEKWSGFHSPRHTVIFSKQAMELCLESVGFTDIRVSSGFNPAALAVSLGSLPQDHSAPSGIRREGNMWLLTVLVALPFALADSFLAKAGIMNFSALKRA